MRRATATASSSEDAPATRISRRTVAPSPSSTIWRARSRTPRRARPRTLRRLPDRARSRSAPFASSTTASFVEHSPSTEMRLKLASTAGRRSSTRLARLERVVGRDDREHRREARVDHPGALRHPADGEARPARPRNLRPVVRRQDRGRRRVASVRARATRAAASTPGEQPVHGQRDADHAGREDDHLLGRIPSRLRDLGRGRARRRRLPCSPVAAFATPALTTTACGSATARWRRETSTGAAWTRFVVHTAPPTAGANGADEREVRRRAADSRLHTARDEPLRGRDGHQTSTPESRSPAVSSNPKSRFTFWIACRRRPCRGCRARRRRSCRR